MNFFDGSNHAANGIASNSLTQTGQQAGSMSIDGTSSGANGVNKRKRADEESGTHTASKKAAGRTVKAEARESVDSNGDDELEQSLSCTADELVKLRRVVRMLDKHGVSSEPLPDEAGVPNLLAALSGEEHALSTLEFYLDLASSSLKARLQSRHAKGKAAENGLLKNGSSHDMPATSMKQAERDIDAFVHAIRRLFEDLKDAAAQRLGRTRTLNIVPKYALHRSIGDLDLFTSAAPISLDDPALQTLKDTDILQVHDFGREHGSSSSTNRSHKLGEVNTRPSTSSKPLTELVPHIEPVTYLYYDPYLSFAPTYDSSTATLSHAQSAHLRASEAALKAWEERPLPPLPPSSFTSTTPLARKPVDPALISSLVDGGLSSSPEEAKEAIRLLEESNLVDARLEENKELLRILQEAQFAKLRQKAGQLTASGQHTNGETGMRAASTETQAAQRLLTSLKSLANARPRSVQSQGIVNPSKLEWRKSMCQLAQHKAEHAYRGSLPEEATKAVKGSLMEAKDTTTSS